MVSVRYGVLLMPSVFFFARLVRTPFVFVFLLLFALFPSPAAVLSGPESVSPHNSILSYWNFGGAACRWRTRGVHNAKGHKRRLPVEKAVCSIFGGRLLPPVRMDCGTRIVRNPGGLHVRRISYPSGMRAYSPAGRHFMHLGGWPCSPKRAMSFFPHLPPSLTFSHRLARTRRHLEEA